MIGKTVHEQIRERWPRSTAAGESWARDYIRILKPFEGEVLRQAWERWFSERDEGIPPRPRELSRLCAEIARDGKPAPPRQGFKQGDDGPRFGDRNEHGQVYCHGGWFPLSDRDYAVWKQAYSDLIDGPDTPFKPMLKRIAEKVFERDKAMRQRGAA